MTSTRGQHSTRSYQSLSINDAVQKLLTASETIRLRGNIKPHEDQRVKQAFNLLTQGQTPATSKTNERRNSYRHFLSYIDKECGSQMVVLAAIGLGQSAVGGMRESARLRLPLEVKKHERSLTASILQEITRRYSSRVTSPGPYVDSQDARHSPAILPDSESVQVESEQRNGLHALQASQPNEQSFSENSQPLRTPPDSVLLQESSGTNSQYQVEQQNAQETSSLSGRVFALTKDDVQSIVISNQVAGSVWMTEPYDNASSPFITITISAGACLFFGARRHQVM